MARIAFCQDTLIEYMGYMQMAAVLRQDGHEVQVFFDDQMNPATFVADLGAFRPDVVGFSVLTPSREWAISTAKLVKDRLGAITVVGNVDAILNPEAFVPDGAFDLICTGEGELALTELCAALDGGEPWDRITGFWHVDGSQVTRNDQRSELVDMGELPLIDRSVYDKFSFFRRSPYLRVYAGRGCPFRCSFCSNTTMTDAFGGAKKYLRKRSPEQFVNDIEQLVRSRPNRIKRIFIIDEVLWFDRKWLREFLTLYAERVKIPFTMNFKFNGGVTEQDVELMARAGAIAINVAAETGDERLRRELLNKPVSNEHIEQVATWMHRYGIDFGSSAFFGLPGQTFEGHIAELDFYRRVGPRYLWTTFFQPYPGINLAEDTSVVEAMPAASGFDTTVHHEMYLDLPDRTRLVNLKKVYHLMYRYPALVRPLSVLCRYRIPLVFDLLFIVPFLRLALWAEGCSLRQFGTHLRNFALNPILRKNQPLNSSGRPYDIGHAPSSPNGTAGPGPGPADSGGSDGGDAASPRSVPVSLGSRTE